MKDNITSTNTDQIKEATWLVQRITELAEDNGSLRD